MQGRPSTSFITNRLFDANPLSLGIRTCTCQSLRVLGLAHAKAQHISEDLFKMSQLKKKKKGHEVPTLC